MKATELRIGNWVEIKDQVVKKYSQIEGVGNLQHVAGQLYSIEELEQIQLTDEWLVRFGFDKTYSELIYREYELNKVGVEMNSDIVTVSYNYGNDVEWVNFAHIKYVHQLQNLYHALTGEELELKL